MDRVELADRTLGHSRRGRIMTLAALTIGIVIGILAGAAVALWLLANAPPRFPW